MITVLIADDHPLLREAIQIVLKDVFPNQQYLVLEASDMTEARRLAMDYPEIDLVLIDLLMPGVEGVSSLLDFRQHFPALPLVVISAVDEPSVIEEVLACGAMGYLPKTLSKTAMIDALRSVLRGETFSPDELTQGRGYHPAQVEKMRRECVQRIDTLTAQQLRVLKLIAMGKPNKVIAYELGISETTVKAHITLVLRKLGVHNRTQAVLAAQTHFASIAGG